MSQIPVERVGLLSIPQSLIKTELEGLYGTNVLQDMRDILNLYRIYEQGVEYPVDTSVDYTPADIHYKSTKALIDKEARFFFSKPPDIYVEADVNADVQNKESVKSALTIYQKLVDKVLKANNFSSALLKAAKDCFIGKRVALMFNINEETGIQVSFLPSLEFVYDVDPNDVNILTKLVAFYGLNDEKSRADQRIYKKKYWLDNGICKYSEAVYDGTGQLVEEISPETATRFDFIPAWVIINDGLSGELIGNSEVDYLKEYEGWYSKLAAADLDAERKGMNPIRWTIDASPESTRNLSISAGAFWDLATDQNQAQDRTAQVGVLDSPMTYATALSTTLDRIKNAAYEQVAIPNVSPEALKGVVSSGKTLKAIYWDLIVRCNEKMLAWRPAIESLARCIIEGSRLYPKAAQKYISEPLPEEAYGIRVDNQYSLPEDEAEEKQVDLAEVTAQAMSRKAYMKKWRGLTDDEAEAELKQIALERELLEDAFTQPQVGSTQPPSEEDEEGEESQEEPRTEEEGEV